MACKPHVALFKTVSGSLPCRQILADFLKKHGKQQIPPKGLRKLPLVLSSVIIYPKLLSFVELEDFVVPSHTNANCLALIKSHCQIEVSMALSVKKVPNHCCRAWENLRERYTQGGNMGLDSGTH